MTLQEQVVQRVNSLSEDNLQFFAGHDESFYEIGFFRKRNQNEH